MIDLREIRKLSGLTQREIAQNIGFNTPQQVNNTERSPDPLWSTVSRFIRACGGSAVVTVEVNGKTLEYEL